MSKIDDIITKSLLHHIDNGLVRQGFFDELKSELLAACLQALPKEPKNWDEWGLERQMWFKLSLDETTAALKALFGEEVNHE